MIYFYAISIIISQTPTLYTIESSSAVNRFVCPISRRGIGIVRAEAFTKWEVREYRDF